MEHSSLASSTCSPTHPIAFEHVNPSTVVQDSTTTFPFGVSCEHATCDHLKISNSSVSTARTSPVSSVLSKTELPASSNPVTFVSASKVDTNKPSPVQSQPLTISHARLVSTQAVSEETINSVPPSGTLFPFMLTAEPQTFNSPSSDSSASVPSLTESRSTEGAPELSPDPSIPTSTPDGSTGSLSNGLLSTASLIASIVGKTSWTSSTPTTVASVVLPSVPSSSAPSFTFRFASGGPIQGQTVTSGDCSLLVGAPMLSSHLSPTPPRSLTFTYCSTPSSGLAASGGLLMSSGGTAVPRVLIHKQAALAHLGQAGPNTSSFLDSYPLTLIQTPTKCTTLEVGASSTSEHATLQPGLTSPKAKLVNLASPVSANVRLLPTSVSTKSHAITTPTASGGSLTPLHMTASPVKAGVGIPGSVWSGLSNPPSSVHPTGLVALQSSQPLLVHTSHEVSTTTQSALTLNPVTSFRSSSGAGPTVNAHLSGTTPAVLAFSLTSTPSTTVATSASGTSLFAHTGVVRQVNPCTATAPLVIRANCTSMVALPSSTSVTQSTVTPVTPASLLKPINLSIAPGGTLNQAFLSPLSSGVSNTFTVTNTPVNIAPAKIPTAHSSTTTTSASRLHPLSPVPSSRHGVASIFSQSSRKRARKQQLASTFPSTTTTTTTSAPIAVCAPTVNVSGSTTVSSIPSTQPPSTTNRLGFSNSPAVLAMTKPVYQPHTSHPSSAVLLSPRPGGVTGTGDSGIKVGCTINTASLNTINGVTPVVNTNSTGFVGIRLLSVRPNAFTGNPACTITAGPTVQTSSSATSVHGGVLTPLARSSSSSAASEASPLMLVTPSSTVSSAAQIRISASHPSSISDLPHTVYVLTTSSYQAMSATSEPMVTFSQRPMFSPTGSGDTHISSASPVSSSTAFTTALMMPGGPTGGLLQVRFRPPISAPATPAPNFAPITIDHSQSARLTSHPIPASVHLVTGSTAPGFLTSEVLSKSGTVIDSPEPVPSKSSPYRTLVSSSTSNSLLHRHLLSPQNPIHNEPIVDHGRVHGDAEDSENISISCIAESVTVERPGSMADFRVLPCTRSTKTRDAEPPPLDHDAVIVDRSKASTCKVAGHVVHEVAAAEEVIHYEDSDGDTSETTLRHVVRKRSKMDDGALSDSPLPEVGSKTTLPCSRGGASRDERFLLTIDPNNGCEWVLTGLPARPSLMPKPNSSTRTGSPYRAKSTHFLSCSEIRCKSDSKYNSLRDVRSSMSRKSTQMEETNSSGSVTRRRRRMAARQLSAEQSSTDNKTQDDLTSAVTQRRLLHDLISLYMKQMELQLVRLPLTTSSVLNLTGWRIFNCMNNMDLLINSELNTMQSVDTLGSELNNFLSSSSSTPLPSTLDTLPTLTLSTLSEQAEHRKNISDPPWATTSMPDSNSATSILDKQVSNSVFQAVELAKGISQRKRLLLKSIQRIQLLTKNVVEHFRPDALRFAETLKDSPSASSSSPVDTLSQSAPVKSDSSPSVNRVVGLRRSVRNCSPLTVRRVRVREAVGSMASDPTVPEMAAPSSPVSKVSSSAASNSSPKTFLCNGNSGGQTTRR